MLLLLSKIAHGLRMNHHNPTQISKPIMQPDVTVSWEQHLKSGNIWRVEVELAMQDTPDDFYTYNVEVYVVASTQSLAQYIAATMYPDYEGIFVDDEPTRTAP